MRVFGYIVISLGLFLLLGCDKKASTLEQVKKYYDSMSDDEIKLRYQIRAMSSCTEQIKKMPNEAQRQLNTKELCSCVADKLLNSISIDSMKLSLMPMESLSDKQKRDVAYESLEIMQNAFPKCVVSR